MVKAASESLCTSINFSSIISLLNNDEKIKELLYGENPLDAKTREVLDLFYTDRGALLDYYVYSTVMEVTCNCYDSSIIDILSVLAFPIKEFELFLIDTRSRKDLKDSYQLVSTRVKSFSNFYRQLTN